MKIITVASAKGGVGKSTFCCVVAEMLASQGKRVLLADMDIGVRSLDILLGVSENTVYNWGDVVKNNVDYRKAVIEAGRNLFLLPAPIDFSEEYTAERFSECIEKYKKDFDFIFLDSPAGLESGFLLSAKASESCVILSTPDNISIRAASYACENARKNGVSDVRLVVNKFNKKLHKKINVDEIIEEEGKLKCYVIDIPCEETIVNVEFAKIKFASLWELQTGVYDKYSSRYIWYNRICPDSTIGLEYLGDYYWKFESVFGDYVTDFVRN